MKNLKIFGGRLFIIDFKKSPKKSGLLGLAEGRIG